MESNPQFAQIVPPSDMVVIVTIQVKLGEVEGMLNICIPYLVLEPIMPKLTTTFWVAANISKDDAGDTPKILQRKLERTKVPLIVELGRINITIQEFLTLGFGDVLQLDTLVKDEMPCIVGKRPKFYCRPGTSGKKMAVQITRVINEGDENTDE